MLIICWRRWKLSWFSPIKNILISGYVAAALIFAPNSLWVAQQMLLVLLVGIVGEAAEFAFLAEKVKQRLCKGLKNFVLSNATYFTVVQSGSFCFRQLWTWESRAEEGNCFPHSMQSSNNPSLFGCSSLMWLSRSWTRVFQIKHTGHRNHEKKWTSCKKIVQ